MILQVIISALLYANSHNITDKSGAQDIQAVPF
jgi:hypothetical protein